MIHIIILHNGRILHLLLDPQSEMTSEAEKKIYLNRVEQHNLNSQGI